MHYPIKSATLISTRNFILIGIGLGVCYWFLESWIHIIFYQQGNLLTQLVNPDLHETWKRLLVVSFLIVFSIYAQYSISMRRGAEAELHQREKELSEILENNPAGIILVESENRKVRWVNTNALKMIGTTRQFIEGHTCHKNLCPADKGDCPVLDHGSVINPSEGVLLTAENANLPILKSVTRLKYHGKDHLLEAFFDLSDRKKMENDLQLAHAELDQIFQTASVGLRVVDGNFNVLKINKTFAAMAGVNEADALGRKCHEVFAGPRCFTPACPLTLILNGKQRVQYYVDKRRPEGRSIPCILTASPLTGAGGVIVGIVQSFQDITDLKQAQEATRLERDKLHMVLSHLMEGVGIVNSDYGIEYQNDILKQHLGECENKTCYKFFRKTDIPCEICLMRKALSTGQVQQCEFESPGGRHYEQAYTPITDVDETRKVVVLLRDVTEKKASMAAMMQTEQLAALGEMAAGVAHEINNPINGIINYAQILVNKNSADSLVYDLGKRMIKEGDRIARIVEGLLSFARRKNERKTLVAVEDILSDSLALTDAQMRKDNIFVVTDIADNLPYILAQAHEIEQVFINIINNARYALNQKYLMSDKNKQLKIAAETQSDNRRLFIRISFHDRGTGIPTDIIDRVCNPFFSTKTKGKSTGLGLSISRGIVNDHGGLLKIESVEGKFTRVIVDLPVARGTEVRGDP